MGGLYNNRGGTAAAEVGRNQHDKRDERSGQQRADERLASYLRWGR